MFNRTARSTRTLVVVLALGSVVVTVVGLVSQADRPRATEVLFVVSLGAALFAGLTMWWHERLYRWRLLHIKLRAAELQGRIDGMRLQLDNPSESLQEREEAGELLLEEADRLVHLLGELGDDTEAAALVAAAARYQTLLGRKGWR